MGFVLRYRASHEFRELLEQEVQVERKKTLLDVLKIIDTSDKRYDKFGAPKGLIQKNSEKSDFISG